MTCRFFREKQKGLGRKLVTNVGRNCLLDLRKSARVPSHTLGWFQWVCDTFEVLPGFRWGSGRVKGAVYEGDLLNNAAFQGSIEILRWLVDEKEWELNFYTGEWAGMGGSVKVLAYLRWKGYEFDTWACAGAARGGHLEALKFLRILDPPCPWDEKTCAWAARGRHLEILEWARLQVPPCPCPRRKCRYYR